MGNPIETSLRTRAGVVDFKIDTSRLTAAERKGFAEISLLGTFSLRFYGFGKLEDIRKSTDAALDGVGNYGPKKIKTVRDRLEAFSEWLAQNHERGARVQIDASRFVRMKAPERERFVQIYNQTTPEDVSI